MKKIPQRQCIACSEMKDKRELIRIIRSPEGEYLLDTTGKLNGRGAYVCDNSQCMKALVSRKGLDRSFKEKIPSQVYEMLEKAFLELKGGNE